MLTDTELTVFKVILSNPFKPWCFAELMQASGQTSRNTVQRTIRRLRVEGLVEENVLGRFRRFTLRLQDDVIACYIGLATAQSLSKPARLALEGLRSAMERRTALFSVVVFGSYAKGKQRPASDLDVAVFVPKRTDFMKLQGFLEQDTRYSPVRLHIHVITDDEMVQMLRSDGENLGKQIVEKHMAVHNPAVFYGIVRRADGFNSRLVP